MCGARNGRRRPTGLPAPGGDSPGDRMDVAGSAGPSLTHLCKPRVRFFVTGWSRAEQGGWRGVARHGLARAALCRARQARGGGARAVEGFRRPALTAAGVGVRACAGGTRRRTGTGAPPVPAPRLRCAAVRWSVGVGGWSRTCRCALCGSSPPGAAVLGEVVFGIGWPGRAGQLRAGAGWFLGGGGFGFRVDGAPCRGRVRPVRRASGPAPVAVVCGAESGCGGAGAGCGGGPVAVGAGVVPGTGGRWACPVRVWACARVRACAVRCGAGRAGVSHGCGCGCGGVRPGGSGPDGGVEGFAG